jgi:hypothetical protein
MRIGIELAIPISPDTSYLLSGSFVFPCGTRTGVPASEGDPLIQVFLPGRVKNVSKPGKTLHNPQTRG